VLPVYLTGQPVQARLEGKMVNTIDPNDYGIRLYGNVYFTSEKMIKEKSHIVQRFVKALAQGWDFSVNHPEEAIDILIKAQPKLEKKMELAFLNATLPFIIGGSDAPIGMMNRSRWEETRDIMVQYAGLSNDVKVDEAFTNKFVENSQM
jgi:ABC-type nitrate/sulfonate/bicarbonate transport system substrate-binding protein